MMAAHRMKRVRTRARWKSIVATEPNDRRPRNHSRSFVGTVGGRENTELRLAVVTVTVNELVPELLRDKELGFTLQTEFAGVPVQASETLPEKPELFRTSL